MRRRSSAVLKPFSAARMAAPTFPQVKSAWERPISNDWVSCRVGNSPPAMALWLSSCCRATLPVTVNWGSAAERSSTYFPSTWRKNSRAFRMSRLRPSAISRAWSRVRVRMSAAWECAARKIIARKTRNVNGRDNPRGCPFRAGTRPAPTLLSLMMHPLPPPPPLQPSPQVVHVGVHHRHHQKGEERRGEEATYHRPRHRGAHLRAGADREEERQHAEDHRQGGHDDGAKPGPSRLDDSLPARQPVPPLEDLGVIHEKDGVLG